jgi:hypothetical protein
MGSYAVSTNTSNTNYTNTPITQSDVTNPINLTNSSAKIGTTELSGSTYTNNTLDGGAIGKAFAFGSDLVKIVADITTRSNDAAQNQSGAALESVLAAKEAGASQAAAVDITQNKTLIYAAVAVVVAYFFFKRS